MRRTIAGTVLVLAALLAGRASASGCAHLNDCSGHGSCDESSRTCDCYEGWGASTDIAVYKAPDCSLRICPHDKAWVDVPTGPNTAHAQAECSNAGLCDRSTGRCKCFSGYDGDACQRTACPNDCSGHGKCVNLAQMATEPNAMPVGPPTTYGGNEDTTTWDEKKIYGCVCDSSWAVGLGSGQRQAAEWFGPDCSLRHCPSNDDPGTRAPSSASHTRPYVETDCQYYLDNGKTWKGALSGTAPDYDSPTPGSGTAGVDFGASGNLCHVDCSNRGICDHTSGLCRCFVGYYGEDCSRQDALARGQA